MHYKYLFLGLFLFFVGCSTKNSMQVEEKEILKENPFTSMEYKNVSKDAIFEAAKKTFILSSKKEFRIDSYRNKLVVSRTKVNVFPFNTITHDDVWEFTIDEKENLATAKLELYRITDHDEKNVEFLNTLMHSLFWHRVNYLLGLNDVWPTCADFNLVFDKDVLCDPIDMYDAKKVRDEDMIKNILIVDRKNTKNLSDIDKDILEDDIELTIEGAEDLLTKDDKLEDNLENQDTTLDKALDDEIEALEKKVNRNIDETLDKIEENIEEIKDSEE